jgi:hypothetical protein
VNLDKLITQYPALWHMADSRNLVGILQRGLLSTSALLHVYNIRGRERCRIESEHRRDIIPIESDGLPNCFIRDQRPMSVARIAATLEDATTSEFFRFLNRHVFFWPSEARLSSMNNARLYRGSAQIVFVVDSSELLAAYSRTARLSPINSGCTTPYAARRSISMFQTISEFDWDGRTRRAAERVAEVAIPRAVPDIWQSVLRLELWRGGEKLSRLNRPYDDTLVERLLRRGSS